MNDFVIWASSPSTITSAAISCGIFIFFLLTRRILKSRFSRRGKTETSNLAEVLVLGFTRTTRVLFFFGVSVYVGSHFAEISEQTAKFIEKGTILIALLQIGSWGTVALNFWIDNHLRKRADKNAESAATIGLVTFFSKSILFTVIALLALNNLGVNVTALVAGLGVGGIAIALALQNILSDLFASLTIVFDKPFIIGDYIAVGEQKGYVEYIGLKTTRLRSPTGEQLIFANGDLLQSRIQNFKRMNERRVVLKFGVTYQTTPEKLRQISPFIKGIIDSLADTRFDRCHFLTFGESSLDFELIYWVLNPEFSRYADIAQSINIAIFEGFASMKIEFAYPTRTLFTKT